MSSMDVAWISHFCPLPGDSTSFPVIPMAAPVDILLMSWYPGMPASAMHWILASEVPSFSSRNENSLLSLRVLTQPLMVMGSCAVSLLRAFLMSVLMGGFLTQQGL